MDAFGDNIYNLYGSTEVAWASIATPEDMRAAPGTAGRAPARDRRQALRRGRQGGRRRARPAGSSSATRCPSRATPAAAARTSSTACSPPATSATSTSDGRLFIDGRDDEMIVSGGENVFPREVEDVLSDHEAIDEAAVIGVDDEKFGQRLKAFVVTHRGQGPRRGRRQGPRQGEPRPLQGPARRRVPRRAPAQPDRQGPEARARRVRGGSGDDGRRRRQVTTRRATALRLEPGQAVGAARPCGRSALSRRRRSRSTMRLSA